MDISFELTAAAGDLFIDLSVFGLDQGSYAVLDAHMGARHLAVSSFRYCGGVVDLDARFAESVQRPGNGNSGPLATCAGGGLANQIAGFSKYDGGVA